MGSRYLGEGELLAHMIEESMTFNEELFFMRLRTFIPPRAREYPGCPENPLQTFHEANQCCGPVFKIFSLRKAKQLKEKNFSRYDFYDIIDASECNFKVRWLCDALQVKHKPSQFVGGIMRLMFDAGSQNTITAFRNSSINTGTHNIPQSAYGSIMFHQVISQMRDKDGLPVYLMLNMQHISLNVVVSGEIYESGKSDESLDLQKVADTNKDAIITYEPKVFPGIRIRDKNGQLTYTGFRSKKWNFCGSEVFKRLPEFYNYLKPRLEGRFSRVQNGRVTKR